MLAEILTTVVVAKTVKSLIDASAQKSSADGCPSQRTVSPNPYQLNESQRETILARQKAEQARQLAEEAKRRAELARISENNRIKAMNLMLAQFAICYYIAMADGKLENVEKRELDRLCLEAYSKSKSNEVKSELLKIYNTPNMNFIVLENYLRKVDPSDIVSFLIVADEIADLDGKTSDEERKCIYKIRKYLTDKTGEDFITRSIHLDSSVNLDCPKCGGVMQVVEYDSKAICPYCSHVKYLKVAN